MLGRRGGDGSSDATGAGVEIEQVRRRGSQRFIRHGELCWAGDVGAAAVGTVAGMAICIGPARWELVL